MNDIVKCCVILHNIIKEERCKNENMGTKCVVSVDPCSEIVPVRTQATPDDFYDADEFNRKTADSISNCRDHNVLREALADVM